MPIQYIIIFPYKVIGTKVGEMASNLESTWAQYLKLSDDDVNHMKRHSQFTNPLGFLVFLDMVSRKMPKKMVGICKLSDCSLCS